MSDLTTRLNLILPTVMSSEFLSGSGLGNEIAFHIFDYEPEAELQVRDHIRFLVERIPEMNPNIRVAHVNLFDFVVGHLKDRNLLTKAIEMQHEKGDVVVLKQLEKILHPNRIVEQFTELVRPAEHDLVFISGVGSVYPLMRAHSLLNNLHPIMGKTPLVLFYPGRYDRQSLKLFSLLKQNNYYRAFKLIP